ncbi:unnamed protein product, partial [Ostreobium quekettii]
VVKADGRALAKYRPVCQCGGYKPDWAKTVRIRDVMLPVDNPVFQKGKSRCSRRLQTPYPPTHWRKGKEVANDVLCFSNPLYVSNKFDGVSQHLGNLDQGGAVHGGCMTLDWGGFFYDQVMKPSPLTKSICGRHMPRDPDAIPVRILPLLEYPLNWRPYIEGALSECRCAARKHRRTQSCAVAARSCRRGGLEGALGETGEDVWHETQEWQEWMGREWLGVPPGAHGIAVPQWHSIGSLMAASRSWIWSTCISQIRQMERAIARTNLMKVNREPVLKQSEHLQGAGRS